MAVAAAAATDIAINAEMAVRFRNIAARNSIRKNIGVPVLWRDFMPRLARPGQGHISLRAGLRQRCQET
jgi:hypothetical protein